MLTRLAVVMVLLMATVVNARPYFLHVKSSFDVSIANTTIPGTDLERINLLRMVTHNALLDAFFLNHDYAPAERLRLYREEVQEDLQHHALLDLHKAMSLVKDVHVAVRATLDAVNAPLLFLQHTTSIAAIDNLLSARVPVAKQRRLLIDFFLNKTGEEEGSDFLPSIVYASIVAAMPPAVRTSKLGSAFISTMDTWHLRSEQGKPITVIDDIDQQTLAQLSQEQLDKALTRITHALEFIVAQHVKAAQEDYWHDYEEANRQAYADLAAQELPSIKLQLAFIKTIQANADAQQRQAAAIAYLLSYVPGHE